MDAKIEKNKSIYGEAATTSASSADTKTFGIIKLLLRKTGLLPFFRWTKNSLFSPNKRLKKLSRFKTTIGGHDIQFSTEDEYSNNWFYPRYVGGRIHEKNVTNTLIKELASAQCFVDVGTNLGWYTCVASKALPHGKIYGFEMDQLNFDLLKKNIELNECQNVEIFNYAVSDAPGEVVYQRPCDTPSPTFRIHRELEKQTTNDMVRVEAISLDEFFDARKNKPDVLKIDVEGAEYAVLRGMKGLLSETKPRLFLEIHPQTLVHFNTSVEEILSLLIDADYQLFEIEELQNLDPANALRALEKKSVIEYNSMIYAIPNT